MASRRTATRIDSFASIDGLERTLMLDTERYLDREVLAGRFEAELIAFMKSHVGPHMSCVDIGANIGYHSLLMAHLGRRVLAFEPVAEYRDALIAAVVENDVKNLSVMSIALSSGRGQREALVGECSATMHWVADSAPRARQTVECAPLDEVIDRPVHFIKIDCDGHEPDILAGARATLLRDRPTIVFEVSLPNYLEAGHDVRATYESLRDLGYSLSVEADPARAIDDLDELERKTALADRSVNVIASG